MGEGEPVHVPRHIDVGEEERDGMGELRKHSDRSIAVICLIRAETCVFENSRDIHEDERVIVDRKRIRDC